MYNIYIYILMNNIVSSFDIFSSESKDLCLIDPMILCVIIIVICIFLYIIGFKLSKKDLK
jgi:hypothetical protein